MSNLKLVTDGLEPYDLTNSIFMYVHFFFPTTITIYLQYCPIGYRLHLLINYLRLANVGSNMGQHKYLHLISII